MPKTVTVKCPNCDKKSEVALVKRTKGSIWIEIALWCCLFVPGLCYSLWRMFSKQEVAICPGCGKSVPW